MGKGTKVVAHEGMGTGTGIFSKCGYGDGHYSTLPIGYPLPSLVLADTKRPSKYISTLAAIFCRKFIYFNQIILDLYTWIRFMFDESGICTITYENARF